MNTIKKLNAEKNNIWSFLTILIEGAAVAYLVITALNQDVMVQKIGLAVVASVLGVNLLAKLYTLIRK